MSNKEFRYYMHDGTAAFSFELAGELSDDDARELERARRIASRRAGDKLVIVDLSYVTQIGQAGQELVRRWYREGAQLVATLPQARRILESIMGRSPDPIAQHHTWLPFRIATLGVLALIVSFAPAPANARNLKPETLQTWNEYVKTISDQNQERLRPGSPFLQIDETPGQAAKLQDGEIIVAPASPHVPLKVPSGLIHHWVGAAFIANVTLGDVLPVLRDYGRYKDFYHPSVIDSKPIQTGESTDQFSMLLLNKDAIAKTALYGDYQSSYTRVNDRRWYSISKANRIQEVADYGTPSQHMLPEDQGTGIIWRLYSVTRFEERDGGVYIEVEAIALSRDIPFSLRWLVDPMVRRISRSSLVTSLHQTEEAVRSNAGASSRSATRAALTQ